MFKVGEQYNKTQVYQELKVPEEKQGGAWDTGYRKYGNDIYIFTNIGVAGRTGHDYDNHWEEEDLVWFAKTKSNIRQPLIKKLLNNSGNTHVFARTNNQDPFTYLGIASVKSFEDVSPVKARLIFPQKPTEIIDIKQAWRLFSDNCRRSVKSEDVYYSLIQKHKYKIVNIGSKSVTVKRLTTDSKSEIKISYQVFKTILKSFNKRGCITNVGALYPNVAIETTIVEFLPMIDFDFDQKNIVLVDMGNVTSEIQGKEAIEKEASDDTEIMGILRNLRIRRGQNKLRMNLFIVYEGKCCITQSSIKETLHACHILPHRLDGNNSSTNALLLRADIHDLFDANYIKIHPETMIITVSDLLLNTEYFQYNGKRIAERKDGKTPDKKALLSRWTNWNNKSLKSFSETVKNFV